MGLMGLTSLSFSQRIQEISIRKVLGANLISLTITLVKGFSVMIILAIFLAAPIIWLIMETWLQNFNFRVDLNLIDFIMSGTLLLVLSWAVIAIILTRTVKSSPVNYLRSE